MVERIDERKGGSTIEGPSVVKGGGDGHRRLIDVRDAKVDFPHRGQSDSQSNLNW